MNLRRQEVEGKFFNCHEPGHFARKCPGLYGEWSNSQPNAIEVVPVAIVPPPRDTGRAALECKILIYKKTSLLYLIQEHHIHLFP